MSTLSLSLLKANTDILNDLGFWGLGFRVWGLGLGVQGLGTLKIPPRVQRGVATRLTSAPATLLLTAGRRKLSGLESLGGGGGGASQV